MGILGSNMVQPFVEFRHLSSKVSSSFRNVSGFCAFSGKHDMNNNTKKYQEAIYQVLCLSSEALGLWTKLLSHSEQSRASQTCEAQVHLVRVPT